MKRLRILLALAVGVLAAGCYNDFDTPAPKKLFTDEDMTVLGLEHVTIKEVKEMFESKCGGLSGTGTNSDFASTRTLKFGTKTTEEKDFEGLYEWPEASNFYIKGKVISSDRQGNIYKSLHIYDGTAAIELKLYSGLFMDFYLDLEDMISQWVYVRLDGLYLGNYRMMLSIGGAPSDGYNTAGTSSTPIRTSTTRRWRRSTSSPAKRRPSRSRISSKSLPKPTRSWARTTSAVWCVSRM